ncbi:hypothetical protein GCM10029963_24430 [Micromonospora andamanensis]
MNRFRMEHLVREVRVVPRTPEYHWYEIDLDRRHVPAPATATCVIGATRRSDVTAVCQRLTGDEAITHVQFEATAAEAAGQCAVIRSTGREPIPAVHLARPPESPDELHKCAMRLTEFGTSIIKIVYPCPSQRQLRAGLDLLERWPAGLPGLSLTPDGGRQARVARRWPAPGSCTPLVRRAANGCRRAGTGGC